MFSHRKELVEVVQQDNVIVVLLWRFSETLRGTRTFCRLQVSNGAFKMSQDPQNKPENTAEEREI